MKGYKHTELGWIPEEWEVKSGSEISYRVTKGSSPTWQGFQYQKEGVLFVTSENVRQGFIDISNPKFLPFEFNLKQRNSILQRNDILINIVGASIGRSCIFDKDVNANVNQAVCVFTPRETVDPFYILHYFQLSSTIDRLLGAQSASARPNLTLEDIRSFKFAMPTRSEQKRISKVLDVWDHAISTLTQLISAKQKLKKGLMQQLLTGKKRLRGFEGEWVAVRIKDLGKIVSGGTPDTSIQDYWNGDIDWVTPTDITALNGYRYIDRTSKSITSEGLKNSSASIIPSNSVIVCTRATIGDCAINRNQITTNQGFKSIVPLNIDFLFLYYKILSAKSILIEKSNGSTFLEISKTDFENINLSIPVSKDEQIMIGKFLETMDEEIDFLIGLSESATAQKSGLMQQLLTGKKRVKVDPD